MNAAHLPNRRHFLSLGAAMLASSKFAPCLAYGREPLASDHENYIDAHVHVWTPDTDRYPLAPGFTKEQMAPPSFTPEELLAQAHPAKVDRVVLIQMSFYQYDNSYMLDAIAQRPEVFRGVAIVDENDPQVRDEMLKLVGQGVRGFRQVVQADQGPQWAASPGINRMWEVGAEADLKMCLLINPDALPAVAEMCQKHPKTPVVIDHMARIGITRPVNPVDMQNLCHLAKFDNVTVKTSAFYAFGNRQAPYSDVGPVIEELRDVFGAPRLMWASDCPFQVSGGHTYQNSINVIERDLDFLTPADRRWMLRDTAEKVFFT